MRERVLDGVEQMVNVVARRASGHNKDVPLVRVYVT